MTRYRALPRNARMCIALEPLWAFFGPLVGYYAPLYQKALGLSEVRMGVVNSANIAAGFVFFMLAAPVTNRLGRRKTSLYFDFIAWSASMVIWAFARSFAWFLVAGILNAVVRIIVVSWNLLITEDAEPEQRASIHGWMNLIGSVGGFTTFLGGLVIGRFGVEPSMRVLYAAGAVMMTAMFVTRYILTRETAAGVELMRKTRGTSFLRSVVRQVGDSWTMLGNTRFLRLLFVFFVANAVLSIDFYRILFLRDAKGLSNTVVAVMPAFGALLSLAAFFLLLPRLPKFKDASGLSTAFAVCFALQGLVLLAPAGSVAWLTLAAAGLQTSYFLIQTFRDAVFMNSVGVERRGDLFSLVQALTMLASIPMGWLSGLLYSVSPKAPFILACGLYAAGFFTARRIVADHGTVE